jgi:hypothetical protein
MSAGDTARTATRKDRIAEIDLCAKLSGGCEFDHCAGVHVDLSGSNPPR